MTDRDAKIIKDSEEAGIPIFVFTAKDKLSYRAILRYMNDCVLHNSNPEFVQNLNKRVEEFRLWQACNHDKVKFPD